MSGPNRYYLELENEETRKALVTSRLDVRNSGVRIVREVGEEVHQADGGVE